MITGSVCFVAGLFFQKFYPVIGDVIVAKVQAGITAGAAFFKKGPKQ